MKLRNLVPLKEQNHQFTDGGGNPTSFNDWISDVIDFNVPENYNENLPYIGTVEAFTEGGDFDEQSIANYNAAYEMIKNKPLITNYVEADEKETVTALPNGDIEFKIEKIEKTAPEETKVKVNILGDEKEVTIKTTPGKDLDDVTISWNEPYGEEVHNLDFEAGDVIDDHGNEGKDMLFTAEASFGPNSSLTWEFSLEVYVEASYEMSGNIGDWDWNTLEINKGKKDLKLEPEEEDEWSGLGVGQDSVYEGSCGYTHTPDGKKLKTPGGTKGMSGINRTNFMRNKQN